MVQRKASQRLGTQAEVKRSHVKLERQSSLNHQQDTRRSRGGGGGDLKKKMKMERSIIAAELKGVVVKSASPSLKNYMKPTKSSNARKERAQVTTIHSQTKNNLNSSKPLKPLLSRQSSLKAIRSLLMMKRNSKGVVANKATCSSTLKDSKFPKALALNRGGTEAKGISVMRVCPYTYCSLNGHFHEPLPPLKCFMSARRQLMKTQKSMKLKGVDTGQKAIGCCSSMDEVSEEFVVEMYQSESTVIVDEYPNESYSDEEMDLLEYVEFDEQVEEAKEENLDILPEDYGVLFDENRPLELSVKGIENKASAFSVEQTILENRTECSDECSDEDFGLTNLYSDFSVEQTISLNPHDEIAMSLSDNLSIRDESGDLDGSEDEEEAKHYDVPNIGIEEEDVNEVKDTCSLSIVSISNPLAELAEFEHGTEESDDIQSKAESQDFEYEDEAECTNCPNDVQASVFEKVANSEGGMDKTKLGMRVIRKKMTEDTEEMKEFNPRGPRFLSVEPDPDAEHVDLRHQTMDERKNSEEWMIDYALRRKLSPAPKKKVAVLVEAFETVMPQPVWKKPTSGFPHARIIQACN